MAEQKTPKRSHVFVYVDTEFTDFTNCDLISVGVVAETGQEFYGENLGYMLPWQSDFVKQTVVPLLKPEKYGFKRNELAARFLEFIDSLGAEKVSVVIDYEADWELLVDLCGAEELKKLNVSSAHLIHETYRIGKDMSELVGGNEADFLSIIEQLNAGGNAAFDDYFIKTGEIQHHALSDARALKAQHVYIMKFKFKRKENQ